MTKSELADMMNSFVSDDDDKWLMFNAKFSSADEVYSMIVLSCWIMELLMKGFSYVVLHQRMLALE